MSERNEPHRATWRATQRSFRRVRIADDRIIGAPSAFDLDLLLRGFLVRLVALDSQLLDLRGETTWTIVAETHDGREPTFKGDGVGSRSSN